MNPSLVLSGTTGLPTEKTETRMRGAQVQGPTRGHSITDQGGQALVDTVQVCHMHTDCRASPTHPGLTSSHQYGKKWQARIRA